MPVSHDFKVFSGNSNTSLAERICEYLKRPLSKADVGRFSDGEIQVEIGENVRGFDVFVIQSTCPPVNDHLMELLIMCDALKRASAASITAVLPYYGYARQDRKVAARTPITAKLVADLLVDGGRHARGVDGHARRADPGLLQHPHRSPLRVAGVPRRHPREVHQAARTLVIVSPDAGGVERARALLQAPELPAGDHRQAAPARRTRAEVMNLIGDVKGKDAIIVDDIIDTAGTLTQGAAALKA